MLSAVRCTAERRIAAAHLGSLNSTPPAFASLPANPMVRTPSLLAQPWRLAPCPCSLWRASAPPAARAGAQGRSGSSSPPSSELELLLGARRLSRTRLAAAVRHERQQAVQERAALQQQLDRARGELRQAQQDMSALQAALQEAEGAAGRAHQE